MFALDEELPVKTIRSQFPAHLIDGYWRRVEELLVAVHGVTPADAKVGIERLRDAYTKVGVGDIQYHASEESTALGVKEGGYLP